MAQTIKARFQTRRDAETSVERLVQEYGVDRSAIQIVSDSQANTVGTKPAGGDVENGAEKKTHTEGEPALHGEINVSATVDDEQAHAVETAFRSCGATQTSR